MGQPIFITPAGSLGTIPEGQFFQVPILAYDPDVPGDDQTHIYYTLIAGELPEGIQCRRTGLIEGVPKSVASLQGVPTEVARSVTSKFTVRAFTERVVDGVEVVDRLRDRTFTLTVTGQDVPEFVTPAGSLGYYYDGQAVDIQIEFTDQDPDENVFAQISSGQLPPGVSISRTGRLTGVIQPLIGPPDTASAGYDESLYDQYPYDFANRAASRNYQFVVEITDGKQSNLRMFEIFVYAKDSMTGDTVDFTGDNTQITGDVTPVRIPVLITPQGNIGRVRHDNWFAFRFIGEDLDGDSVEYLLYPIGNPLPGNLQLDSYTGWLYGYIPDLGVTERTFEFSVRLRKRGTSVISDPYFFNLEIIGDIENTVTWLTPADLGYINNGAISTLSIVAVTSSDRTLQYRLKPGTYSINNANDSSMMDSSYPGTGVYNKLPQGLQLLQDGDIAGRVSFNTFALDNGTTTFDKNLRTRLIVDETTFDSEFTFTVEAYSSDGAISVFKTFTVRVLRAYNEPYVGLYIKAMPPDQDRQVIEALVNDQTVIPAAYLYRPNDPYFGRSTSIKYMHAYALSAAPYEEYVAALYLNHYHKTLVLGEIKTARAVDANDNVIYEVVYSEIQDNLVNNQGISVSKAVTLNYPVTVGDQTITTVYPNSLDNMRDQMIASVGQVAPGLPLWMTSKQIDGRVLGFTPCWVIAYVKPGRSREVAYNFINTYGENLNTIDFEADRYELEGQATHNWIPFEDSSVPGEWKPNDWVTFDNHTQELYRIPSLGMNGTIQQVNNFTGDGSTTEFTYTVLQPAGAVVVTVNGVKQTYGSAPGSYTTDFSFQQQTVVFNTAPAPGTLIRVYQIINQYVLNQDSPAREPTIFDGDDLGFASMNFTSPTDTYEVTDRYDKYLVFPKTNILG